MSRENPTVHQHVPGSLIGGKTYQVNFVLTLMELWGSNTVPDDIIIVGEQLPPIVSLSIEEGEYVMEYAFAGKTVERKVRIVSDRLLSVA
jgi:hypothetical protein